MLLQLISCHFLVSSKIDVLLVLKEKVLNHTTNKKQQLLKAGKGRGKMANSPAWIDEYCSGIQYLSYISNVIKKSCPEFRAS